jgi:hypothetical protein
MYARYLRLVCCLLKAGSLGKWPQDMPRTRKKTRHIQLHHVRYDLCDNIKNLQTVCAGLEQACIYLQHLYCYNSYCIARRGPEFSMTTMIDASHKLRIAYTLKLIEFAKCSQILETLYAEEIYVREIYSRFKLKCAYRVEIAASKSLMTPIM